ncbi:MAG: hypothetical protein AAB425_14255 [Bdellovibrionota bacterium]
MKIEQISKSIGLTRARASTWLNENILGPMEKGVSAARLATPPSHELNGVDLRTLPKYVSYRAALLREKFTLQITLGVVTVLAGGLYASSRVEVSRLTAKLREKEFILAPGVQDFTPVSPQSVPDSHVRNAVMEYLQGLGNVNPVNIDEQYARLAQSMSPDLKIQFEMEAGSWRAKVKADNISEILSLTDTEIRSDAKGAYQVTALARRDSFVNSEHIGSTDEVIEMVLKLVAPSSGRRWFLEITKLSRTKADAFQTRQSLGQKKGGTQ